MLIFGCRKQISCGLGIHLNTSMPLKQRHEIWSNSHPILKTLAFWKVSISQVSEQISVRWQQAISLTRMMCTLNIWTRVILEDFLSQVRIWVRFILCNQPAVTRGKVHDLRLVLDDWINFTAQTSTNANMEPSSFTWRAPKKCMG